MSEKQRYVTVSLLLVIAIIALLLNRPMRISVLENVFIEVGEGQEGPPEFFEKALVLDDGRTIYLSDGECKIR